MHLALSPGKAQLLAEKAVRKAVRLATYAVQAAGDPNYPACIEPLPQDRRFRAEACSGLCRRSCASRRGGCRLSSTAASLRGTDILKALALGADAVAMPAETEGWPSTLSAFPLLAEDY